MQNEAAMIIREGHALATDPVMTIGEAVERFKTLALFTKQIMREGTDFGTVPGTNKPSLLKPGAEKLTTFFGFSKRFAVIEKTEDWTGKDHGGEAFFYYLYRCSLYKADQLVAECDGSANSFESKYRWRKGDRVCPACGMATILKSKEAGKGWFCWKKKGGCGATFDETDQSVAGQAAGRIPNPDIADQVNTIQKMAQKRALVGVTLLAVNASEMYTQDMEDFGGDYNEDPRDHAPRQTETRQQSPRAAGGGQQKATVGENQSPVDTVLLAHCVKEKRNEKAGTAFYQAMYGNKSAAEKATAAEKLGLIIDVAPIPQGDGEEIDPEISAAIDQVNSVRDALIEAKMSAEAIQGEILRLLPEGCKNLTDCTYKQIDEVVSGLEIKLQQLKAKAA